jgi:hypothetical protein
LRLALRSSYVSFLGFQERLSPGAFRSFFSRTGSSLIAACAWTQVMMHQCTNILLGLLSERAGTPPVSL